VKRAFFNWSGGKDSALALHYAIENNDYQILRLLTSINKDLERISMHGVRKSMLIKQVESIGIPLTLLELPTDIDMNKYDELMGQTLQGLQKEGLEYSVFGDIFLEDLKAYRDKRMTAVGLKGFYPLWKRNTTELIHEFIDKGFRTILVSINGAKLGQEFAGQELTLDLVKEFPKDVDPCGENGEFHTYVFDGPIFNEPIKFQRGDIVEKIYPLSKESKEEVTYWFQDLY